jgi:hypothetical protein
MKRGYILGCCFGLLLTAVACAEGTRSANSAADEQADDDSSKAKPGLYDEQGSKPKSKARKEEPDPKTVEPKFTPGMSINDAINAIPQGLEREEIAQEDLNRPLMDPAMYKPCKLSPAQHFVVKYAVWLGKAVAMEIHTQPASKQLEECLRGIISRVTWHDKVRSLNISEVNF